MQFIVARMLISIAKFMTAYCLVLCLAGDKSAAEEPAKNSIVVTASSEQIAELIKQLDADEFKVRQRATQKLFQIGVPTIKPLGDAVNSDSLEVSHRSMALLERFLEQKNQDINVALEVAFDEIAKSNVDWAGARARKAMYQFYLLNQDAVIGKLGELGADADIYSSSSSPVKFVHLYLDVEKWKGKDDDLFLLNRLPGIYRISVLGAAINDNSIPTLCKISKTITQLDFYGTKISESSLEKLKAAFGSIEMIHRKGALLGIQSESIDNGRGCNITSVHPDSAANLAGIQVNDVITKIDDTLIRSFQEFSGFIVQKNAGDKIKVELNRRGTKMTKEVTLSNWKLHHIRDITSDADSYGATPEFRPGKFTKASEASILQKYSRRRLRE